MNWSEKYRPTKIDDLYLTYDSKTKIKQWIKDFVEKKENFTNCLLLHGPPGVGKTSLANIILKSYDFDIIEFNSSDIRNQKTLKDKIDNITNMKDRISLYDVCPIQCKAIGCEGLMPSSTDSSTPTESST